MKESFRSKVARRIGLIGPLLIVLALGILVSGVVLQWKLAHVAPHPRAVAYLGEEKHLVNAIQGATLGLVNFEDGRRARERLLELRSAMDEWMGIHHRLVALAGEKGFDREIARELNTQVFPRYEEVVSAVRSVRKLAEGEIAPPLDELKRAVRVVEDRTQLYLFFLNHLDLKLAAIGTKIITGLQSVEGTLIIVAGALLLVVVLWLYVPALRQLRRYDDEVLRLVDELREKNSLLSELYFKVEKKAGHITECLNTLSHEVRNPLATVTMATDLLKDELLGGEPTIGMLPAVEKIERNTQMALRTLSDFLEMTRIEGGMEKLEIETFPLSALTEKVIEPFRERTRKRGLELVVRIDESAPEEVATDGGKLERILENLLTNALKYTDNGRITLAIAGFREDGTGRPMVSFEVRDTGIGIAPDCLATIFEPFTTPNKRKDSIGLGLAITRRLVEAMSGEILVESSAGRGSVFTVQLPQRLIVNGEPRSEKPIAEQSRSDLKTALKANQRLRGLRVFLLDDSEEIRELTTKFLESVDVEVTAFGTAEEALGVICAKNGESCDLMLIDISLPGTNGIEVAKRIRAFGNVVPLVAVTSYGLTYTRKKCLEAGFTDFVEKPLTPLSLAELLMKFAPKNGPAGAFPETRNGRAEGNGLAAHA